MNLQRTLNSLLLEPIQVQYDCYTYFRQDGLYACHDQYTVPLSQSIRKGVLYACHNQLGRMYCILVIINVSIQRVPRYELLLKDLLKHTPEVSTVGVYPNSCHSNPAHTSQEHPDYSTLKEALNFIQKVSFSKPFHNSIYTVGCTLESKEVPL